MSGCLNFKVESWSAWASSIGQKHQWIEWANHNPLGVENCEPFDVSRIPAMKRRRMSSLSKMATSIALECLDGFVEKPVCVFASKNGELTRTMKIIHAMINQEDISPTDFSLSVHNTASGLLSIQTGNKEPFTSVAAGDESFVYGMLEACLLMSRFPTKPVLLVYLDEPLPNPIADGLEGPFESISIALLLTHGDSSDSTDAAITFNYDEQAGEVSSRGDIAKSFMRFFLGNLRQMEANVGKTYWRWSR